MSNSTLEVLSPSQTCVLRIGLALFAQFGPGKFPSNWWSLAFCVGCYAVLSVVINLYAQRVEGDAFLICKPRKVCFTSVGFRTHNVGVQNAQLLVYTCVPSLPKL